MVSHTPRNQYGKPVCHYCHDREGSQMHEIINRAQTSSNPPALRLSFRETLCSWLCPECHSIAPAIEEELWMRNFRAYGKERVLDDINDVIDALGFRPQIRLPE